MGTYLRLLRFALPYEPAIAGAIACGVPRPAAPAAACADPLGTTPELQSTGRIHA